LSARIDELLAAATLEEKVSLLAGASTWTTAAIARLGIPAMKLTDGPNGARGAGYRGQTSASFPVGSALAASWDESLVEAVGRAIAEEARTKDADVVLGPTINLHRTPIGGRNFESYGEDPLLAGRLGSAFVRGVQSTGVGACVKHFVCNDTEHERHTVSSEVDERTLREVYLRPFEIAVREAAPWSVMSAYNRVNGTYASSHRHLIEDILRGDWGFDGFVVSDWGAALETVANLEAGMDLEMPGPPRTRGDALLAALERGEVDVAQVDACVRRVLTALERTGRLARGEPGHEHSEDRPEHRALARRAAIAGSVLIANDGLLPLQGSALRRLAVIGPNAVYGQIQGGGSSGVNPHYAVMPLDALRRRLPDVEIAYARGAVNHKYVPLPEPATLHPPGDPSAEGLRLEIHADATFTGEAATERVVPAAVTPLAALPLSGYAGPLAREAFGARLTADYVPTESGEHEIGLSAAGRARLWLDDELLIDLWDVREPGDTFFGRGSAEVRARAQLGEGERQRLRIEVEDEAAVDSLSGIRLGLAPAPEADLVGAAETAAREADAVVMIVGSNPDWESEGHDRRDLALPGGQDALIERVLQANPRTAVVVNAGGALAMPWLDAVPAVLWAWLPGQELGEALADVLLGEAEPGGRMPTTFPRRLEDTPAYTTYPGEQGRLLYGERGFIGHRWYDARGIAPRVPFGHGLCYTRFEWGALGTPGKAHCGSDVTVDVEVANVGERAGSEVVQVYLGWPEGSVPQPPRTLAGFARAHLEAGERRRIPVTIPGHAFAWWDVEAGEWRVDPGCYRIEAGASSREIRCSAELILAAAADASRGDSTPAHPVD